MTGRPVTDPDHVFPFRMQRKVFIKGRHAIDFRSADVEFFREEGKHFFGNIPIFRLNVLQDGNDATGRLPVLSEYFVHVLEIDRCFHDKTSHLFVKILTFYILTQFY